MSNPVAIEILCAKIAAREQCPYWRTFDRDVEVYRGLLVATYGDERHKINLRFLMQYLGALTTAISENRIEVSALDRKSAFNIYGYVEIELKQLDG